MPANNFTIGKDLALVVVGPSGVLELNNVTSYKSTRNSTDLTSKGIDGLTRHANLPDSYTIAINLDRTDATLDRFFARLEADYFAGVNIKSGTVLETITEKDGSITQFRYEECVLKYEGGGEYKGDSFVSTTLTIMATRKILVS